MSYVITDPHTLTAPAGNMQDIGLAMAANDAAAAGPTTGVIPAAADAVSGLTAAQFASRAEMYQGLAAATRRNLVLDVVDQFRPVVVEIEVMTGEHSGGEPRRGALRPGHHLFVCGDFVVVA
jgi:PE family